MAAINGTQALVLAFFVLAWAGLVAMLSAAPGIYARELRRYWDSQFGAEFVLGAVLTVLIAVTCAAVVRRRRWAFWVNMVAFFTGGLRVPAAALQLAGYLAADGPARYVVEQGCIGTVQVGVAVAMLTGYRRSGIWGRF